jgi:uncharacterized protein YidB (DUF937 family)
MGLLDDVLKSSLGSQSSGKEGRLLEGVLDALRGDENDGLSELSKRSEQKGFGDVLSSWIAKGPNRSISSDQVTDLLGRDKVADIAQRAGVATSQAPSILAAVLPALIDRLTPDGVVPKGAELAERSEILLASVEGDTKPKADFSDVSSGSSTTAERPKEAEPETYTVAAGDNLSKIAKRFLGDANEWRRIYDANRAVIGPNPDLIKPGQKLTIPKA